MNPIDPRGLTPPLTEARLARQYAAIAARTRGRPRGRAWRLGWAVATAAAGAAVFLFVWAHRPASNRVASSATSSPIDGALIEAPPTDGVGVTLGDGSYVALAAGTRARFTSDRPTAVRIDLERGAVEIEATHVEGRRFTVGAGSYEVRVVGTHFVVRRAPHERVEVRVDRGAVEIASGGGETRTLRAGEQWSAPDGAVDAPASASPSPSAAEDREPPQGPEAAERTAPPPARAPVGPASPAPRETAKGLFDEAQRDRAEGRAEEAAQAFDRLRRSFRHDPHAPLAAFELGRLRLDVLGDPRGAEEAFRDTIALGPSSPFREDAEARRIEALSRMGDAARCAAARDAYLARWPNATYRRVVEVACGGR